MAAALVTQPLTKSHSRVTQPLRVGCHETSQTARHQQPCYSTVPRTAGCPPHHTTTTTTIASSLCHSLALAFPPESSSEISLAEWNEAAIAFWPVFRQMIVQNLFQINLQASLAASQSRKRRSYSGGGLRRRREGGGRG